PQAYAHNHNIYLAQGNETTLFNASLNYYNQQGIIQTSSLERAIARLSIDQFTLNGKLRIGISVTNTFSNANLVPYRNTVLKQMLVYLPVSPVKNPDGSYFDDFIHTSYYNPVSLVHHGKENMKYNNVLGIFTAQLRLPFGLKYDLALSYQNYSTLYGAYYDSYYTQYYNNIRSTPDPPANPALITLTGSNGEAVRNTYQNTNKILETFFTWDRRYGGHALNAVLGYSFQETVNGQGFQATSTNFPVDNLGYNNLALSNPYAVSGFNVDFGQDNYQHERLIADFGRFNYSYKDRYLLQASIRRDGSSVFGVNHRWGYFPAAGLAWRISEEPFMKSSALFSDVKLRASYGITGNSLGFSPTAAQALYVNIGNYYYQGTPLIGIGPTQSANPDLRWEKTATANIGLDFSIGKGRLSGSLEVYNKRTTDLIWSYPVDPNLVPSGSITANVGTMNNKGIELSLTANPVHSRHFNWTSTLNLAHNDNEIVSLSNNRFRMDSIQEVEPDGTGQSGIDLQVLLSGRPIGQFFTLKYAGDSSGISQYIDAKGKKTTLPAPGTTDYRLAGNAQPKLLIGWGHHFQYNNFDGSLLLRSVLGNKIFNATLANMDQPNSAQNVNIPLSIAGESPKNYNAGRYSTRYIENGSYCRLDYASLGYTFTKLGRDIHSLRLYLAANNLFVITGYKGIDPEVNQGGLAPGVDVNNFYPKTRTFLFGVNLSL
ncbi:MAG TPA: SusC/RagA family TonB-linked outer membrane protein, partial [Puia sp.]|nr:SusC/RagA family TonB-linked outer membrane protein [Puia sp.]